MISILIPVFEGRAFLEETLQSVAEQIFPEWEVIAVEDGSNEDCADIVAAFAKKHGSEKVRYIRQTVNQGQPRARNIGFQNARGAWIALLDADDCWRPDHLSHLYEAAQGRAPLLIHSQTVLFESTTGRELELRFSPSEMNSSEIKAALFLQRYLIQPSSLLMSRAIWEAVGGFDPDIRWGEDIDFILRIAEAGFPIQSTNRITCRYRQHQTSLTKKSDRMLEGWACTLWKHRKGGFLPRYKQRHHIAEVSANTGKVNFWHRPRAAALFYSHAFRMEPWRFDYLAYGIAAWSRGRGEPR